MPRARDALADRLHSAAIHLLRHVAEVDAESGLSASRLSALSVLVYGGPTSMTALATAERVTPATITHTVTALEQAGLATRRRDTPDARQVTVEATAAGRALMTTARTRRLEVLGRTLSTMTESQLKALDTAVTAIESHLSATPCDTAGTNGSRGRPDPPRDQA